jgi:hypothetical protein
MALDAARYFHRILAALSSVLNASLNQPALLFRRHTPSQSEDAICSSKGDNFQTLKQKLLYPSFRIQNLRGRSNRWLTLQPPTPRPPSTSSGEFLLRLCGCADSTLIFVFQFRLRRHRLRRVEAGERRGRRVAACADAPDQWAMSSPFSYERYASTRR